MLDQVCVRANDVARARTFYVDVLATVGLRIVDEEAGRFADFGCDAARGPQFSIEGSADERPATRARGIRIAFRAPSSEAVDAFHAAALARAGRSYSTPASRSAFGPGYYSAALFDPDGNLIEVVWRPPVDV